MESRTSIALLSCAVLGAGAWYVADTKAIQPAHAERAASDVTIPFIGNRVINLDQLKNPKPTEATQLATPEIPVNPVNPTDLQNAVNTLRNSADTNGTWLCPKPPNKQKKYQLLGGTTGELCILPKDTVAFNDRVVKITMGIKDVPSSLSLDYAGMFGAETPECKSARELMEKLGRNTLKAANIDDIMVIGHFGTEQIQTACDHPYFITQLNTNP